MGPKSRQILAKFPSRFPCKNQRFRKGAGGRGLATDGAPNAAKVAPQNCDHPLLMEGNRKKDAEKMPESLA